MARQVFLSSVLGSIILAIVLVAFSGCQPVVKEEAQSEPNNVTEAAVEKSEPKPVVETKVPVVKAKEPVVEKKEVPSEKTETPEEPTPNATAVVAAPYANEPELTEEEAIEVIEEPKVDLGKPLVDNPDKLVPLRKDNPAAWIDKEGKQVVMLSRVVQRNAPLEMFACQKNTKEHESVLAVDTTAMAIHTALLLVGAESGHPVQYQPEYIAATGTPIAIEVIWKDADGKIQKAKAQDWIKNVKTGKPMEHEWVFAGSAFWVNKETGENMYLAEQGEFVCLSNFPNAMLDLPIKSSDQSASLLFQAWEERIPPLDTPVTIVLTPKKAPKKKREE